MRSPLTGVVFAVDLTGRFDAILPLLIGSSIAFGASVLILKRSVLTEKIARRGYHVSREYDVDPLETAFVEDVMSDDMAETAHAPVVQVGDTLRHVAYVMAQHHITRCAVVGRDDGLEIIGSVELADLLVGRRHDLAEMRDAERVLQPRLPRLTPNGRQPTGL